MRNVAVGAIFLEAMHSLDMERVKQTLAYRVMLQSASERDLEQVIEYMFDHLRNIRDNEPRRWADIVADLKHQADTERLAGGEQVNVTENITTSKLPKLDGENPRGN